MMEWEHDDGLTATTSGSVKGWLGQWGSAMISEVERVIPVGSSMFIFTLTSCAQACDSSPTYLRSGAVTSFPGTNQPPLGEQ